MAMTTVSLVYGPNVSSLRTVCASFNSRMVRSTSAGFSSASEAAELESFPAAMTLDLSPPRLPMSFPSPPLPLPPPPEASGCGCVADCLGFVPRVTHYHSNYRMTMQVSDMGLVDLYLGCSTILLSS